MRRSRLAIAATLAAMLGGGAACSDNDPLGPSDVMGSTWRLVSLQESGGDVVAVQEPSRYTLEFGADGRLGVRSDCNSCGGTYALADSSLEVGPLACTRAYCGDTSLDGRYTTVLQRAQSVAIRDDELIIVGNGGALRLRSGP